MIGCGALVNMGMRLVEIRVRPYICLLAALASLPVSSVAAGECVVLLHGLARTPSSMKPMASTLRDRGYLVVNVAYPSRKKTIEELAPLAVNSGVSECPTDGDIHFVAHSLGGILLRYYLEQETLPRLGRVVMLAPPNQGSEVVDRLRYFPGFSVLNGPAGAQLGTDEGSLPLSLGPVEFDLGVIAGTDTFNPILSQYLPNPDDGKVSVESTKVDGMSDFIQVPYSHPFIMKAPMVIEQTVEFIESGHFDHNMSDSTG